MIEAIWTSKTFRKHVFFFLSPFFCQPSSQPVHRGRYGQGLHPQSGLLTDLEQRGLLHDTLVVWSGEFGRTPDDPTTDGRGHNNMGYSMWLAGGGTRGGFAHGATDDHGYEAIEGKVHIHDLHATLLHLLGLEKLAYRHRGRDFRLTDVHVFAKASM